MQLIASYYVRSADYSQNISVNLLTVNWQLMFLHCLIKLREQDCSSGSVFKQKEEVQGKCEKAI